MCKYVRHLSLGKRNSSNVVLTLTHISELQSVKVSKSSIACTSLVKSLTLQVSINLMTHIQTAVTTEREVSTFEGVYCSLKFHSYIRTCLHKRKMLHQDKFGVNFYRMVELHQKQPLQTSGLCQTEV